MSSICRNCGVELLHNLSSEAETWKCMNCGWKKTEQFVTKCCQATWFVGGRGMTNFYVCEECDAACDVVPVARTTPGKKVARHWLEERRDE